MSAIRVFDLSAAVGGIRAGAYFADSNGRIFSKISNTGPKIALLSTNKNGGTTSFYGAGVKGTNTASGRYFSFAGTNMDSARTSYHKGILDSYIKRYLHENPKVAALLSSAVPVAEEPKSSIACRAAVPKAGSFEFYVIARIVHGSPSFSSGPKVHTDVMSARDEALRLAGLYPGVEFMIFKANSSVSTGSTVWKVAP